jgi:hypothetical protein
MFGRMVFALSDIPCEVRQDELTNVQPQATTVNQPRRFTRSLRRASTSPYLRVEARAVVLEWVWVKALKVE